MRPREICTCRFALGLPTLESPLSRRQLLEFALCSRSRAADSQRERPRVGDHVDTMSLSLVNVFSDFVF